MVNPSLRFLSIHSFLPLSLLPIALSSLPILQIIKIHVHQKIQDQMFFSQNHLLYLLPMISVINCVYVINLIRLSSSHLNSKIFIPIYLDLLRYWIAFVHQFKISCVLIPFVHLIILVPLPH